jgi:hypothetical protein
MPSETSDLHGHRDLRPGREGHHVGGAVTAVIEPTGGG